jgi:2-C-methyl-D-erythritol 2,4-cyclodiphosphate synthase
MSTPARPPERGFRVGIGYDSHRLVEGRKLVLGGVEIPHERGLAGHSDADVVTHAVIEALLGAVGAGDLGTLFPSEDERWRDADLGAIGRGEGIGCLAVVLLEV